MVGKGSALMPTKSTSQFWEKFKSYVSETQTRDPVSGFRGFTGLFSRGWKWMRKITLILTFFSAPFTAICCLPAFRASQDWKQFLYYQDELLRTPSRTYFMFRKTVKVLSVNHESQNMLLESEIIFWDFSKVHQFHDSHGFLHGCRTYLMPNPLYSQCLEVVSCLTLNRICHSSMQTVPTSSDVSAALSGSFSSSKPQR